MTAIAGCGGSGSGGRLLSARQANRLSLELNSIEQAMSAGDCAAAQRAALRFQSELNGLSGVNSTLIENLNQGSGTIQTLTARGCQPHTVTPPKKRTHTSTTTHTTTTTVQSTTTFTAPVTTTATTPTYPTTTYTAPSTTSTTGGQGLGDTSSTPSTPTTTPTTGGQGLADTTTTAGGYTTSTGVAGTQSTPAGGSGSGF